MEKTQEENTEDKVEKREIEDQLKQIIETIIKQVNTQKDQEKAPICNVNTQQLHLEDTKIDEIDEKQLESWTKNPITRVFYQWHENYTKILIGDHTDLRQYDKRRLQESYRNKERLQKQLYVAYSELVPLKKGQRVKEERSEKRKNSIPQSTRDTVTNHEFDEILKMIEQNNFVASRKKGAIILLYVTGLRISDLLKINVQNMQELLEKGETFIDFTKKNCRKHGIRFSGRIF